MAYYVSENATILDAAEEYDRAFAENCTTRGAFMEAYDVRTVMRPCPHGEECVAVAGDPSRLPGEWTPTRGDADEYEPAEGNTEGDDLLAALAFDAPEMPGLPPYHGVPFITDGKVWVEAAFAKGEMLWKPVTWEEYAKAFVAHMRRTCGEE